MTRIFCSGLIRVIGVIRGNVLFCSERKRMGEIPGKICDLRCNGTDFTDVPIRVVSAIRGNRWPSLRFR